MLFFLYYGAVIALAYYVGRRSAGYGIAIFIVAVALHQFAENGVGSFVEPIDCDYGVRARDC